MCHTVEMVIRLASLYAWCSGMGPWPLASRAYIYLAVALHPLFHKKSGRTTFVHQPPLPRRVTEGRVSGGCRSTTTGNEHAHGQGSTSTDHVAIAVSDAIRLTLYVTASRGRLCDSALSVPPEFCVSVPLNIVTCTARHDLLGSRRCPLPGQGLCKSY